LISTDFRCIMGIKWCLLLIWENILSGYLFFYLILCAVPIEMMPHLLRNDFMLCCLIYGN
jgi:hypothetical protein